MDLKRLGNGAIKSVGAEQASWWKTGEESTYIANAQQLLGKCDQSPVLFSPLPSFPPSISSFCFSSIVLDEESRQSLPVKNFTSTFCLGEDDSEEFSQMSPRHRKDLFSPILAIAATCFPGKKSVRTHLTLYMSPLCTGESSLLSRNSTLVHTSVHSNDRVGHLETGALMRAVIWICFYCQAASASALPSPQWKYLSF